MNGFLLLVIVIIPSAINHLSSKPKKITSSGSGESNEASRTSAHVNSEQHK
jgi:hypothetical protein